MHYQEANGGASMNVNAGWELEIPTEGLKGEHKIFVKVSDGNTIIAEKEVKINIEDKE